MHVSRSLALPAGALLLIVAPAAPLAAPAEDLARLCEQHWQAFLESNPVYATSIGDHRYDDRLSDITPAGIERDRQRLQATLEKANAIDERTLSPADRLTLSALKVEVESGLDNFSCGFEEWVVDPLSGPQVDFFTIIDFTRIETPEDGKNFVARTRAMGAYLDAHVANLRTGLGRGRVASEDAVRKVLEELDDALRQPVTEWSLARPLAERFEGWQKAPRESFRADLRKALDENLKPALERYRDFLKMDVQPKARPQEKSGLAALPGGRDCYLKRIKIETSVERTPEQLHQLGLDEVARFRKELSALGQKVLGTSDVAAIQKKLRGDPAMHFANAAQVENKAREALARAKAAMPKAFGMLPKADCTVKVMGLHESPNSTIAYYRQPASDGSRPGYYMINTYKPETRPRYEAEALAFHEAIPGHHLQIAIAQELTGMPEFRKHQGVTAYVEGWALYTERLADEMGLYSGDVDRIGMLSYDAWRACRLVVDTGMHYMGWSRQKAIDYMIENTVLAENNIVNEVDRYLTWPGQALAYKVGQIEILALREEAKKRLGDRFDIRQFHDVVLENGAVALPVLGAQVRAWIDEMERVKVGQDAR
jgi:uncharacterized protein (DUF885 family)